MKQTIRDGITALCLGIIYYIWLRVTGLAIPCLFRYITGYRCPGCGVTTLLFDLLQLDFAGAFQANPFLFVTAPFLLAELGFFFYWHIQAERFPDSPAYKKQPPLNRKLLTLYCIAFLIFGVVRNLDLP